MSRPSPAVSVVIPTYQRCASVRRTLLALGDQTLSPADYEVVVSIDGSTDGSREMVAALAPPYALRAVWQPNQGRAAACNAGIREARGSIIILLDDDMSPAAGFLAAHLRAHSAGERLGVIGAAPIAIDAASPSVVRYVGAKFNRHLDTLARSESIGFRSFYSGNFSIRREVLNQVGLFDEDFKVYGNEDGELALRLLQGGVRLLYEAAALAHQHYEKDFAALARDNIAKGQTAVLCARKYPGTFGSFKLSTYRHGSHRWRLLRGLLLGLSDRIDATPGRVVRFITWLERRRPARLADYYTLALDYFYWLGARPALRAHPSAPGAERLAPRSPRLPLP